LLTGGFFCRRDVGKSDMIWQTHLRSWRSWLCVSHWLFLYSTQG